MPENNKNLLTNAMHSLGIHADNTVGIAAGLGSVVTKAGVVGVGAVGAGVVGVVGVGAGVVGAGVAIPVNVVGVVGGFVAAATATLGYAAAGLAVGIADGVQETAFAIKTIHNLPKSFQPTSGQKRKLFTTSGQKQAEKTIDALNAISFHHGVDSQGCVVAMQEKFDVSKSDAVGNLLTSLYRAGNGWEKFIEGIEATSSGEIQIVTNPPPAVSSTTKKSNAKALIAIANFYQNTTPENQAIFTILAANENYQLETSNVLSGISDENEKKYQANQVIHQISQLNEAVQAAQNIAPANTTADLFIGFNNFFALGGVETLLTEAIKDSEYLKAINDKIFPSVPGVPFDPNAVTTTDTQIIQALAVVAEISSTDQEARKRLETKLAAIPNLEDITEINSDLREIRSLSNTKIATFTANQALGNLRTEFSKKEHGDGDIKLAAVKSLIHDGNRDLLINILEATKSTQSNTINYQSGDQEIATALIAVLNTTNKNTLSTEIAHTGIANSFFQFATDFEKQFAKAYNENNPDEKAEECGKYLLELHKKVEEAKTTSNPEYTAAKEAVDKAKIEHDTAQTVLNHWENGKTGERNNKDIIIESTTHKDKLKKAEEDVEEQKAAVARLEETLNKEYQILLKDSNGERRSLYDNANASLENAHQTLKTKTDEFNKLKKVPLDVIFSKYEKAQKAFDASKEKLGNANAELGLIEASAAKNPTANVVLENLVIQNKDGILKLLEAAATVGDYKTKLTQLATTKDNSSTLASYLGYVLKIYAEATSTKDVDGQKKPKTDLDAAIVALGLEPASFIAETLKQASTAINPSAAKVVDDKAQNFTEELYTKQFKTLLEQKKSTEASFYNVTYKNKKSDGSTISAPQHKMLFSRENGEVVDVTITPGMLEADVKRMVDGDDKCIAGAGPTLVGRTLANGKEKYEIFFKDGPDSNLKEDTFQNIYLGDFKDENGYNHSYKLQTKITQGTIETALVKLVNGQYIAIAEVRDEKFSARDGHKIPSSLKKRLDNIEVDASYTRNDDKVIKTSVSNGNVFNKDNTPTDGIFEVSGRKRSLTNSKATLEASLNDGTETITQGDVEDLINRMNSQKLGKEGLFGSGREHKIADVLELKLSSKIKSISNLNQLFTTLNENGIDLKLDLSNCINLTDLSSLEKASTLKTLDITGCTSLTDFRSIAKLGSKENPINIITNNENKIRELLNIPLLKDGCIRVNGGKPLTRAIEKKDTAEFVAAKLKLEKGYVKGSLTDGDWRITKGGLTTVYDALIEIDRTDLILGAEKEERSPLSIVFDASYNNLNQFTKIDLGSGSSDVIKYSANDDTKNSKFARSVSKNLTLSDNQKSDIINRGAQFYQDITGHNKRVGEETDPTKKDRIGTLLITAKFQFDVVNLCEGESKQKHHTRIPTENLANGAAIGAFKTNQYFYNDIKILASFKNESTDISASRLNEFTAIKDNISGFDFSGKQFTFANEEELNKFFGTLDKFDQTKFVNFEGCKAIGGAVTQKDFEAKILLFAANHSKEEVVGVSGNKIEKPGKSTSATRGSTQLNTGAEAGRE